MYKGNEECKVSSERQHYIVSIQYKYEEGNIATRRFLILDSLNSENAVKRAIEYIPRDKTLMNIILNPFEMPGMGSVAFELVV